jgi:hypothetical protein
MASLSGEAGEAGAVGGRERGTYRAAVYSLAAPGRVKINGGIDSGHDLLRVGGTAALSRQGPRHGVDAGRVTSTAALADS